MLKSILVVAFALLAATDAQRFRCGPERAPREFEGLFSAVDHHDGIFATGIFFYDAVNMRVRRIESDNENITRPQYDVLDLFHSLKKRYIVDLKTRECSVSNITEEFRPIAVRPDSTYIGEYTVGLAQTETIDLNAKIDVWEHEVKYEGRVLGNETLSFIQDLCLPVSTLFFGEKRHVVESFFDLSLGISNPNAFDIPPECISK